MLFLDVKVCCPEAQPCDVCAACPSLVPSRVSQEASQLPVLFSAASAAGSALLLSEQQLEPLSIKLSTSWYARIKLGLPLYGMSATQLLRSSCPIAGAGLKHLTAGWGKAAEARRGAAILAPGLLSPLICLQLCCGAAQLTRRWDLALL